MEGSVLGGEEALEEKEGLEVKKSKTNSVPCIKVVGRELLRV